ncbi:MAG: TetR/AcrR family transcriptional regulator [Actinomycetota bacterium]
MRDGSNQRRPRGRPPGTRLLSLGQVVDAALALLDEHGPAGLSMRRIADLLGVHNNAIYTYVADRAALEAAIVERLLVDADPALLAGPPRIWRRRLTRYASSLRAVLRSHPGAMSFFMTAPMVGDVALDVGEATMRCFLDAGLDSEDASRASYLASLYVLGFMAFDIAETDAIPPLPTDDERMLRRRAMLGLLDPKRFPLTISTATTAANWVSASTFEWGLQRILDGLVGGPGGEH